MTLEDDYKQTNMLSCTTMDWWQAAVDWIKEEQNGGLVHSAIQISHQRELVVTEQVEENSILFRIPSNCLFGWDTVARDVDFGRDLVTVIEDMMNHQSSLLYNSTYDLAVATFLASNPESAKHYRNTLPKSSDFDALPRRWTEEELSYLTGSPLLSRIAKEKEGVQSDYKKLQATWTYTTKNNARVNQTRAFPSFAAFSDSLAAVTSRAFAGFGGTSSVATTTSSRTKDEAIAMVPLLDLCNHCRGQENITKNLSYEFNAEEGAVVVKSNQIIRKGEILRITYGARSNGVLLLNYGFCISDNVEPDGSSNDILEFQATPEHSIVFLKQGPKSHAFHGFVNALDQFRSALPLPPTNNGEREDAGDIPENFDDVSEGDGSFDWEAATVGNNTNKDGPMHDENEVAEKNEISWDTDAATVQLVALTAFEKRLEDMLRGYTIKSDDLKDAKLPKTPSKKHFAALMILSEYSIMYFTAIVIRKLKDLLGCKDKKKAVTEMVLAAVVGMDNAGRQTFEAQAESIANAFLAVRFSCYQL